MKRGFTLIELLVVIGIMGLLGTVSVGGYRAMQRGMEERGVIQNVNAFVRTAFERAQIDRLPTAIYMWNETLREESSERDETVIVVGHAVAVRQLGRLSNKIGQKLVDEFGDLDQLFPTGAEVAEAGEEEDSNKGASGVAASRGNEMYLYCLDGVANGTRPYRSVVSAKVVPHTISEIFMQLGNPPTDNVSNGKIGAWAFQLLEAGGATWKVGSAYGVEFAELTLPKNFIFGKQYSQSLGNPVEGEDSRVYRVGVSTGNGVVGVNVQNIDVYSLRPGPTGKLEAQKVGTSDSPMNAL